MMDTKKAIILGSLFVLMVVLAVLFFSRGGEEKIKESPALSPYAHERPIGEEVRAKKVDLFFPAEEDSLLHREEREIVASSSVVEEARQVIEELLKGSRSGYLSPFPPETKLREIYLTAEGIAYVDFTREIQEKHLHGSSAEMATIFSIVNSLTYNFEPIKKVFILVDGREKETLGGHISLAQPFLPKYDLVSQ
ncbi:MAG: GerMN domain-containing protein [Candidatus Aminicenantales bacterium]